ncbi:hypothetical protein HSBAA_12400 [Vreelandella sulfidaeris]|uniref:AraC-type transcription regulator ligand-binding domain-containing protein n=1 Tax=Vreelandella sulfidaeris TaxID=115553 RepID=A0A455U9C5_9GAMM|nr:hypothetical protein HSBAA_12400 [Halomonas sulfidaeris]
MDAALDVLRMIRFTGGIFLDAEFSAPWCVVAQVTPEDCRPFTPVPEGILAYHYVSAGRLLLQVGQGLPVAVPAGHIVLLPRNDSHLLGSELTDHPVSVDQLLQPMSEGGLARIVHGGGGETTRLLCGFLYSETPCVALIGVLPSVMTFDVAEGAARAWIESSFRFAAAELAAGTVRSPALLARLAELLLSRRRSFTSLVCRLSSVPGWVDCAIPLSAEGWPSCMTAPNVIGQRNCWLAKLGYRALPLPSASLSWWACHRCAI